VYCFIEIYRGGAVARSERTRGGVLARSEPVLILECFVSLLPLHSRRDLATAEEHYLLPDQHICSLCQWRCVVQRKWGVVARFEPLMIRVRVLCSLLHCTTLSARSCSRRTLSAPRSTHLFALPIALCCSEKVGRAGTI
jgi:hypothetical protein